MWSTISPPVKRMLGLAAVIGLFVGIASISYSRGQLSQWASAPFRIDREQNGPGSLHLPSHTRKAFRGKPKPSQSRGEKEVMREMAMENNRTLHEIGVNTRRQNGKDVSHLPVRIRKLPELIIIGSKKCGTEALKSFLELNPHFAVHPGEPHFFDQDRYEMGSEHYRKMMAWSYPNQITVEGSPRYMYTSFVPERVRNMLPDGKLTAILCDPVIRVLSEYAHLLAISPVAKRAIQRGKKMLELQLMDIMKQYGEYPSFERIVFKDNGEINTEYHAISNGLYAKHLKNWLKYFPQERIHIIDASAFLRTPWVELNRLAKFVGVPPVLSEENFVFDEEKGFYCRHEQDGGCFGENKGRTHEEVSEEQLEKLRQFYGPHNEELFQLIGWRPLWG